MPDVYGADIPLGEITLGRFIDVIRLYLRDYAELNRLIKGEEHSNRMIAWSVIDTLTDFNGTPPFTNYSLSNFPIQALSILRKGVVVTLLESAGLLNTRNHLTFSDGGIQVGVSDKTPLLQSWIQLLKNDYEEKKQRFKIALNIENAWGHGVSSEYGFVSSGFYSGW